MDAIDAERTLRDIERVRHGTRQALNPVWFANAVFGAFFLGAALLNAAGAGDALALGYWVGGWIVALSLIFRQHVRIERSLGVESRIWDPSVAIVLAMIGGIVAANVLTDGAALPVYVAAAGLLALGVLFRDGIEGAAGAALAVLATALLVVEPDDPGRWSLLGLGIVLAVAGFAGRARDAS